MTVTPSATPIPTVRLAVVGLGGIAQSVHLPLLRRQHAAAELVAVVDLSAQRAAQVAAAHGPGVLALTSVADLVAAHRDGRITVDGVILATTGSHAGDTLTLVRAGIAVLAEKPLGLSSRDLTELAREPGVADRVRVGYMKEYDPASALAREVLREAQIRAVTVEVLHPADGNQLDFARLLPPPTDIPADRSVAATAALTDVLDRAIGTDDPRLRVLYPNVVLGSIVHDIGLLRFLIGGIGTIERAERWGEAMPGSLALAGRLARHEAPWQIGWHFIPDYPEYRETVTVHHATGTVQLVFAVPYLLNAPTRLTVLARQGALGVVESVTTFPQEEAFERELVDFLELCRGHPLPGASVQESLDDVRVGQLMLAALARSSGVPLAATSETAQNEQTQNEQAQPAQERRDSAPASNERGR